MLENYNGVINLQERNKQVEQGSSLTELRSVLAKYQFSPTVLLCTV